MTGGAAPAPAGTLWAAQHQGQGDPERSRCSGLIPWLLVGTLAEPCSSCAPQGHTWSALHELGVVPTLCPPTPQSDTEELCESRKHNPILDLKDPGQGCLKSALTTAL